MYFALKPGVAVSADHTVYYYNEKKSFEIMPRSNETTVVREPIAGRGCFERPPLQHDAAASEAGIIADLFTPEVQQQRQPSKQKVFD